MAREPSFGSLVLRDLFLAWQKEELEQISRKETSVQF